MDHKDLLDEIEKDYLAYREAGGYLSILAFTTEWLKRHREVVREEMKGNGDQLKEEGRSRGERICKAM